MPMLAPRHRAYPPLHPWDLPLLVDKDKDKAVNSQEEEQRFPARMICFGIITSRVVGLPIGIGMGEGIEGGWIEVWIEIEIHEEEDRIQEVIRCMDVGQGDLLPVLQDLHQEDTITPLVLPTIPLTHPHPTLLLPTTNQAIRPRPIMLCPPDPVRLLKIILIIDLHRDLCRIIIQVVKGIMALPLPVGMASTAVVVGVMVEGTDVDRMESVFISDTEKKNNASWVTVQHNYLNVHNLHGSSSANLVLSEQLDKTNLSVPFFFFFGFFFFVIPNLLTYHIGDTVRDRVRMATSSTCHDSFLHMQLFHKIILVFFFYICFLAAQ